VEIRWSSVRGQTAPPSLPAARRLCPAQMIRWELLLVAVAVVMAMAMASVEAVVRDQGRSHICYRNRLAQQARRRIRMLATH
jgi:hypothetical protein